MAEEKINKILDYEGLEYFWGKVKPQIEEKMPNNLGVENKDLFLGINKEGQVVPVEPQRLKIKSDNDGHVVLM